VVGRLDSFHLVEGSPTLERLSGIHNPASFADLYVISVFHGGLLVVLRAAKVLIVFPNQEPLFHTLSSFEQFHDIAWS
jgi:hypothetical protein